MPVVFTHVYHLIPGWNLGFSFCYSCTVCIFIATMINGGNLDRRVERVRTEIVRVCDVDVQDAASTIPRAMIHTIRLGDVSSA